MTMVIGKLVGITIICVVMVVVLRSSRPEQALILSVASVVLLLLWLLQIMEPLILEVQKLMDLFTFGFGQGEVLLKSLGICLLTQMAADVCRDVGEQALASNVELAGKISVLLLCLPLFRQLLGLAVQMID